MSEFAGKLSSYNLLNYLLTGVVFATLAEVLWGIALVPSNLVTAAFIYYFIGLLVSRLGSIALQPVLEKAGFVKPAPPEDFILASQTDGKLEVLSEQNNIYRTLASAALLLLLLGTWGQLVQRVSFLGPLQPWIGLFALLAIFLFSYRKQTQQIVKRVDTVRTTKSTDVDE